MKEKSLITSKFQFGNTTNIIQLSFAFVSGHSGIQLDDATHGSSLSFITLIEIIQKLRAFCIGLNEACTILETLHRIFQPENFAQQLTHLQVLKELSYLYLESYDSPKSIEYAQKCLNLSQKLNVQNFKADADYVLGMNYARQNMFQEAMLHVDAYEQHCNENGDDLEKGKASLIRSKIACQRHEDEASLLYANDFLEKTKNRNDKMLEIKALGNLSVAHMRLFNMQQSLIYSEKCLQLAKKLCHAKMEMDAKFQKATAYLVLGEYKRSYDMLTECLCYIQTNHSDKNLESLVLNNISYAALNLTQNYDSNKAVELKQNALLCIQKSLSIAEFTKIPKGVALAHLNMGLIYMECYEDNDNALEHFQKGLTVGEELGSARIIHQSYCCLGRLCEAKGESQVAQEYYTKALKAGDPPCTHWGEAENLRFSPDYLLALHHIGGKKWKDAAICLQRVIKRCKRQGKSVKDSLLKISFNDKLTKPYQYLQYAYLEMKATKEALVTSEEGRARDFYDKLVDINVNAIQSAPNPENLLKISKAHNTAVLFLSQLTVVGRVYCWLIGRDGTILDVFWVPQDAWKPLNRKMCFTMHELAVHWVNSKTSVEYRAVETLEDDWEEILSPEYFESTSETAQCSIQDPQEKKVLNSNSGSKYLFSAFPEEERNQSFQGKNEFRNKQGFSTETETRSEAVLTNPLEDISNITSEVR